MAQKTFKQKSIMPFSINDLGISPELTEIQALMPIDPKDRENLKKDILESGEIRDPIKVYANGNGNYLILCGYNRWRIAQEIGWENVPIEVLNVSQSERQELVWKDNLNRRHLTREQKQRLIDHFLKTDPEQSDRNIAKKTGSDHKTVGDRRGKLESFGEIPRMESVKKSDGKSYSRPQKKTPTKAPVSSKKTGEVDFKQLARDYHFELHKVKADIEKMYNEYKKRERKHRLLAEKLLKKKDKEKGLFERERSRIYSEVSNELGIKFVFLRELLK